MQSMRQVPVAGSALIFLFLAGCSMAMMGKSGSSPQSSAAASIVGVVSYRERFALPADAEVEVVLVNLTRSRTVVASTRFVTGGSQVPLPFRLRYAAGAAPHGGRYALEGRIRVAGQVRFSTREPVAVGIPASGSVQLQLSAH